MNLNKIEFSLHPSSHLGLFWNNLQDDFAKIRIKDDRHFVTGEIGVCFEHLLELKSEIDRFLERREAFKKARKARGEA